MTAKSNAKKPAKSTTKVGTILKLLSRPGGAGMPALETVTGWQPHSVRAALTGLRKQGHTVERSKDAKGVTIYRVSGDGSK